MAEDKKPQEAKPQTVSDSQAFKDGKLQPGYQYHYENYRDKDGNLRSRRVVAKKGK